MPSTETATQSPKTGPCAALDPHRRKAGRVLSDKMVPDVNCRSQ